MLQTNVAEKIQARVLCLVAVYETRAVCDIRWKIR